MRPSLLILACLFAALAAPAAEPVFRLAELRLIQTLGDDEIKLLKSEIPPGDLFNDIGEVTKAGDEALQRGEPVNAKELYLQALTGLKVISEAQPAWQPNIVDLKSRYLETQIKSAVVAGGGPITPPPTTRPLKKESDPDGILRNARKFRFNGEEYYSIPL